MNIHPGIFFSPDNYDPPITNGVHDFLLMTCCCKRMTADIRFIVAARRLLLAASIASVVQVCSVTVKQRDNVRL